MRLLLHKKYCFIWGIVPHSNTSFPPRHFNYYHGRSRACCVLYFMYVYGSGGVFICSISLFNQNCIRASKAWNSIWVESRPSNVYYDWKVGDGWMWLDFMLRVVSFKKQSLCQTLGTGAKEWNRCRTWSMHQHSGHYVQGKVY